MWCSRRESLWSSWVLFAFQKVLSVRVGVPSILLPRLSLDVFFPSLRVPVLYSCFCFSYCKQLRRNYCVELAADRYNTRSARLYTIGGERHAVLLCRSIGRDARHTIFCARNLSRPYFKKHLPVVFYRWNSLLKTFSRSIRYQPNPIILFTQSVPFEMYS